MYDIIVISNRFRNTLYYLISKKEYVLDGATVMYGSASELRAMLEYDFSQEREFSYYRFKK